MLWPCRSQSYILEVTTGESCLEKVTRPLKSATHLNSSPHSLHHLGSFVGIVAEEGEALQNDGNESKMFLESKSQLHFSAGSQGGSPCGTQNCYSTSEPTSPHTLAKRGTEIEL